MRVSTGQIYSTGLKLMQDVQNSLTEKQEQISTGIELSKPSDDPIAFSQALKLQEEISINTQFSENIQSATGRNEISESMMGAAVTALQRIRELTLQASNDTLSPADRAGIGEEVRILQDELASVMNATDGSGEFMFGGFQGRTQPFVLREGGGYDFLGDEGQRVSQISSSSFLDVSDSGKEIFVDIPSADNTIVTRIGANNDPEGEAVINVGEVIDQAALDDVFPDKFVITFGDPVENQNRRTYTVRRVADNQPVIGTSPSGSLEDITYVPGEDIEFHGVRVRVGGRPQPGDAFFVESSGNQSMMNTVERLALALESLVLEPEDIEDPIPVVGSAAPARPTLTSAGNYVAEQRLTLTGDDGTIQVVEVESNATVGSVAAALDALTGLTATFNNAEATLDFTTTSADEGDEIVFNLNGIAVQVTAGDSAAATYANIDTALGAVLPTGGLSYVNSGDGVFIVRENTGENVSIDSFEVVEFPGFELDVTSGVTLGETIEFTMTGSAGEVLNVSYVAATADVDELTTEIQNAIAGAGLGAVLSATQAAPGQPALIRYQGDTDGDSEVMLSGLTDNAGDDLVLSVNGVTGTDATDSITNGAVSSLRSGTAVNVTVHDGVANLGVQGAVGDMVSLRDGGNDSTAIAAMLDTELDVGYQLSSNTVEGSGGLLPTPPSRDAVLAQFRNTIEASVSNLDNSLDNVTRIRSKIGARLNLLETSKDLNEGMKVELENFLSNIRDLDYAEALTDVQMKTFILQAAQNTFVKMTNLSLFSFL